MRVDAKQMDFFLHRTIDPEARTCILWSALIVIGRIFMYFHLIIILDFGIRQLIIITILQYCIYLHLLMYLPTNF